MILQTERLRTIEQVKAFVGGSEPVDCKPLDRAFDYHRLGKAERGWVRRYIARMTSFSAA